MNADIGYAEVKIDAHMAKTEVGYHEDMLEPESHMAETDAKHYAEMFQMAELNEDVEKALPPITTTHENRVPLTESPPRITRSTYPRRLYGKVDNFMSIPPTTLGPGPRRKLRIVEDPMSISIRRCRGTK